MQQTSQTLETLDPTGENDKPKAKVFFPNLDGLRFFCFLAVFFYHSFATDYADVKNTGLYWVSKKFIAANGNLGVNFFFVLSGFLITYLLLTEQKKYGRIDVKNFYLRRILRIWPLFYFCVIFGFFIFPQIKLLFHQIPSETAHLAWYLTFLNNFDFIRNGLPDSSTLGTLWSVAIEEQFYFVWPLLIFAVPAKYYKYLFGVIITCSFIFRYSHANSYPVLELHTLSCISDMTIGGCFALLSFNSQSFINKIKTAPKTAWITLYLVTAICFFFRDQIFNVNSFGLAIDRLILSIFFGLIIVEQNYADNSLFKMGNYKWISKLGTYTYGLYCLHMIGILIVAKGLAALKLNKNVYQVIFLEGVGSLLVTMLLAFISYNFFEKRFLQLKERFSKISKN